MASPLALVADDGNDDRELARRAASGDERAFETLYERHSGRVFALCMRMSGSRQQAAELTQDVWVKLWQKLGSFRGESALSSWIHRLTVNHVLTNARGEQRRHMHERPESGSPTDDHERGVAVREPSVSPKSVEDAIDLENAIAALPPRARTVFVLHDVEGYQHDEIAKLTGTAEGTCRAQLHRARKLLMEVLER